MLSTNKLLKHAVKIIASCVCFLFLTTVNAQTVTCPTETDLGTFDCNSIFDAPLQVTNLADAMAAPYNIVIEGAMPQTFAITEDSGEVFYCEDNERTVTRIVTIYNDDNVSFSYDPGEEISTCTFTISTTPDTTAPTFTAPGDTSTTCSMGIDPSITGFPDLVSDDDCPDLTGDLVNISDSPATNGSCPGEVIIVRSWTAVDPCGNAAEPQTQKITVKDTTGPIFTVPDDITLPCGSDPMDNALAGDVTDAMDECDDSSITANAIIDGTRTMEDTPCPGSTTYIKVWGARDGCGNVTTKEQTIIVECPADCTNQDPCEGDIVTDPAEGECECTVVEPQVLGCTEETSANYNPDANCDDGSCGLNDSAWADQGDGTATATIAGPLAPGDSENIDITFTIPADAAAGSFENFAEISSAEDEDGNPATDIDSTPDNDPDNDNYTDDVTDNTDGDEDDHDGAVFEIACIDGCTDTAACNYNPDATCDDGSCMAVPTCNSDPCVGDVTELSADGCSCEVVTPQVLGCTDAAACNYDANANCDDGSCMAVPTCNTDPCAGDVTELSADGCSCEVVTPQVLGCTDATACNYNANANCDDGSCLPVPTCNTNPCWGDIEKVEGCDCVVVEPQVLGCNDPLAENYDENANCNDGTCMYPSPCPPKMRVCTAPLTPIDICLPCILSGELDA